MTGQRSRAETKAKDNLSEVVYGATGTSSLGTIVVRYGRDPEVSSDFGLPEVSSDFGLFYLR